MKSMLYLYAWGLSVVEIVFVGIVGIGLYYLIKAIRQWTKKNVRFF